MDYLLISIIAMVQAAADPLLAPVESRYVIDCESAIDYSNAHRGAAVIVVHNGNILCQDYRHGGPDDARELASGVKSFAAIMAAAAVHDGLLDLDERVADTITEWQDGPDRSQITIRQLLSLSSGLRTSPSRLFSYADAIRQESVAPPGERFAYGPIPFAVFGEIMRRKLIAADIDLSPADYFRSRVLLPLGIDVGSWSAVGGDFVLSEGASMSPMSLARLGNLIAHGGELDGVRLLDAEAVEAMFQPSTAFPGYGMGWWVHHRGTELRRPRRGPLSNMSIYVPQDFPSVFTAAGAGDQRLYYLPEYDLVIVRMTRGVADDRRTRNTRFSDIRFLTELMQWHEDS